MRKEKELLCEIGRRMYLKGLVAANDGNLSIRTSRDKFLVTPTGVSKGYMTPEMMVMVNLKGEVLEGSMKPSSEFKLHSRVYSEREDVNAVIHAHPPIATAFTISGMKINDRILTEEIIQLGYIPTARYGTPSTIELPDSITEYVQDHNAILLAHHGALTMGTDLLNAYYKMETVEFSAKVNLYAKMLGTVNELSDAQVEHLVNIGKVLRI